jgi:hypothetical protein
MNDNYQKDNPLPSGFILVEAALIILYIAFFLIRLVTLQNNYFEYIFGGLAFSGLAVLFTHNINLKTSIFRKVNDGDYKLV